MGQDIIARGIAGNANAQLEQIANDTKHNSTVLGVYSKFYIS